MLNVAINGKFLVDHMQGIVRYARELVGALDEVLDERDHVEIVVPPVAHDIPEFKNIEVVRWGNRTGTAWEQLDFAQYLRKHPRLTALNLCNVAPLLGRPGVTAIHDVMYRACPELYTSPRDRLTRAWHCLRYALVTRRERAILTVSEYSKEQIERYYPHARGKVRVVPNAWQHVRSYVAADDWRDRFSVLEPGNYLFSIATLARNKNMRWVYEVAERNPRMSFAIAGMRYESDDIGCPPNVHLLGFVSDADACALIQNCRAFLYPSLYEGFGLPPLEALALGAQVVCSDATSLPEVMGPCAHYVDPYSYKVNLEALLAEPVAPAHETLDRYSWQMSCRRLLAVLETNGRGARRARRRRTR